MVEPGMSFGRLAALLCCPIVVLAIVGGVVWAIVYFTRRQSRSAGQTSTPPVAQPPHAQPPSSPPQPPAPPASEPTPPSPE
ncbi:hypothetical protein AB0H43_11735 [Hamadaea sp. NPDC050747]|uniref:hypothetical protein n=1 Tax=Hamadaea sp. NPDC050747 TaxID=3155789 RepID=UPI0033EA8AAF